jgi:hypothetical protein
MRLAELPIRPTMGDWVIVMFSIVIYTRTLTCRLIGEATAHEVIP